MIDEPAPPPHRHDPALLGGTRWPVALALLALAYGFFHHVGTMLKPLGEIGHTRWADWVDLLTPYCIVGLAALTLVAAEAQPKHWAPFGLGSLMYTQGHGIHLAANSVGNVEASDAAYFWDEYVGHYVTYVGLALLFAMIAAVVARKTVPPRI